MLRKKIAGAIGSIFSIGGIIGIILSNAVNIMFIFVIAAISGLFVIAVTGQQK